MPNKCKNLSRLTLSLVIAGSFGLAMTNAAQAEPVSVNDFKSQPASLDETPLEALKPAPAPKVLNGQVSHSTTLPGQSENNQTQATAVEQQDGEEEEVETIDLNQLLRKLKRIQKSSSSPFFRATITGTGISQTINLQNRRPKLSPEYFRSLNYGVIGLSLMSFLDGRPSVITGVYPTCPAAIAGITPGDIMYEASGYRFKPGDDQRTLWRVCGGKSDTPIDVTVIRQGQKITFHMNRMNIEDIADLEVRGQYEALLSVFGPPPN